MHKIGALLAGLLLAWVASSCGSGGSGTVAAQLKTATVAQTTPERERTTPTVTQTETVTEPARTVTQPTRTVTETQTQTVVQQTQTTKVGAVAVPSTTTTASDTGDDDFPWWGWVLVGLAIAGLAGALFQLGRRRGRSDAGDPDPPGPEDVPPG